MSEQQQNPISLISRFQRPMDIGLQQMTATVIVMQQIMTIAQ